MRIHFALPLLLALVLTLLAAREGWGDEAEEAGWTRVEAVPDWVFGPALKGDQLRVVTAGQSNLLRLVFPAHQLEPGGRRILAARLRPVLGSEADRVAEAVSIPPPAAQVYYVPPRASGSGDVVGGRAYTCFVRWDLPLADVLAVVPEARRDAVREILTRGPAGRDVAWEEVAAPPGWVETGGIEGSAFRAVTREKTERADVTRALSALRAVMLLATPIKTRLRPVLGNDLAFAVATDAAARAHLLRRAIQGSTAWQLWDVPLESILQGVPEGWHEAAREALAGPEPASPYGWVEVKAEPAWARAPLSWPGHVAIVQIRRSNLPEVAKKRAAALGEQDVAKVLVSKLAPVTGPEHARRAAAAAASKRKLARHVLQDQPPSAGKEAVPGSRLVTTWSLWQVPVATILEALPAQHRDAVHAVLTP